MYVRKRENRIYIYECILKNNIDIPTKVIEREREGMCMCKNVCERDGEYIYMNVFKVGGLWN